MTAVLGHALVLAQVDDPISSFSKLSEDQVVFLWLTATFIIIALVIIIAVLIGTIGSIVRHRAEVELKRELVERGMSAEEIERVVPAKADASEQGATGRDASG